MENNKSDSQDSTSTNDISIETNKKSLKKLEIVEKSEITEEVQNPSKNDGELLTNIFKKPDIIISSRKDKFSKIKKSSQHIKTSTDQTNNEISEENDGVKNNVIDVVKESLESNTVCVKERQISLPYNEPTWGGKPEKEYKIEVLKSGVILETIDVSDKSFHVIGRLPTCDVSLAHPTISRYHAILQYRKIKDENNEPGLYVYDLGSTHGTFWNGNRIKPNLYVRICGGHMIKFGCSQRKFILQTPPEDVEEESELTVTELKEKRKQELEELKRKEMLKQLEIEEAERLKIEKEENEGIDWGMGEDADEETDLSENPFAQTNNEELFLDDPKKTLRGWFEREGYDLEYQTEERGIGQFLCWVDLPVDSPAGKSIRAEALVKGKKKESVIQCALEACRILDRYGLLRQSNHEARKRKNRNWEEDDYYDSDEDNFLDRTGTIERKRKQRMRMAGKLSEEAETYNSLMVKYTTITNQILEIEKKLQNAKNMMNMNSKDNDEDALEAFMNTLSSNILNKSEIMKLKVDLNNLRKEESQLLKLIDIAKPANLPSLKSTFLKYSSTKPKEKIDTKVTKEISQKSKRSWSEVKENALIDSENHDSDDSFYKKESRKETNFKSKETDIEVTKMSNVMDKNDSIKCINKTSTENYDAAIIQTDTEIIETHVNHCKKSKKSGKNAKETKNVLYSEDSVYSEDYSTWVPPTDQSGDGRTNLNDKYGY